MSTSIPRTLQRPSWSIQSIIDPAYAKLGALLKDIDQLGRGGFAFLGIPFEGLLINDIGGKGGPDGLRAALAKLRPYSIELDLDFSELYGLADVGDVEIEYLSYELTFQRAEAAIGEILRRSWTPVISGGSHSITEATLRAFSEAHGKNVGVVWFDGHPDLMPHTRAIDIIADARYAASSRAATSTRRKSFCSASVGSPMPVPRFAMVETPE